MAAHECLGARPGLDGAGGIATYLRGLLSELARRGVRVDVFTAAHGECEFDRQLMLPFARVHHIRLAGGRGGKQQVYERRGQLVAGALRTCREMGLEFDLVYSHYWISGLIGAELSRAWRTPHATTFHTFSWLKPPQPPTPLDAVRLRAETELAREADAILASSPNEAKRLVEAGAHADRLHVAPPGVDVRRFQPRTRSGLRRRLGLPEAKPLLLWAGRQDPIKGLEDLIAAHAQVLDSGAHLALVGGRARDAYRIHLETLTRSAGSREHVSFLDAAPHARMPDYYAAADIFVYPSHYESFGLAALEASASGIPVVGADVDGLRQLVENGKTGLLSPPRRPASLAASLRLLIEDGALRERLGLHGRQLALARRWSQAASAHVEAFGRLLDRSKGSAAVA